MGNDGLFKNRRNETVIDGKPQCDSEKREGKGGNGEAYGGVEVEEGGVLFGDADVILVEAERPQLWGGMGGETLALPESGAFAARRREREK